MDRKHIQPPLSDVDIMFDIADDNHLLDYPDHIKTPAELWHWIETATAEEKEPYWFNDKNLAPRIIWSSKAGEG